MLALDRHIDRLNAGMNFLGIRPPRESTEARFAHIIGELLERVQLHEDDARVRIQVWRGGALGYQTPDWSDANISVSAFPITTMTPPDRIGLVQLRRIPNASLPSNLKLSNGLNYILAQREAQALGFQEGVMCTVDGYLSETTMANLFWIKDGVMFTPDTTCDILEGIMRSLVIEALEGTVEVETCRAVPGVLEDAEAVFTTNSLRELHPVSMYNEVSYNVDLPVVQRCVNKWVEFRNDMLI